MIFIPGAYTNINTQPNTYGLTATERAEILNWAVFDALPFLSRPLLPGLGDRYLASMEFEGTDHPEIYQRMKKILDAVPLGEPVTIKEDVRNQLHKALDLCWFSQRLADNFFSMSGWQRDCYLRARYIFVSHWLSRYPDYPADLALEHMTSDIERLGKLGQETRFALQDVPFTGKGR